MKITIAFAYILSLLISSVAFAQRDLGLEPTIKVYPTPPIVKPVEPVYPAQSAPQVCIQGAPQNVTHCQQPRVVCTACHNDPHKLEK